MQRWKGRWWRRKAIKSLRMKIGPPPHSRSEDALAQSAVEGDGHSACWAEWTPGGKDHQELDSDDSILNYPPHMPSNFVPIPGFTFSLSLQHLHMVDISLLSISTHYNINSLMGLSCVLFTSPISSIQLAFHKHFLSECLQLLELCPLWANFPGVLNLPASPPKKTLN